MDRKALRLMTLSINEPFIIGVCAYPNFVILRRNSYRNYSHRDPLKDTYKGWFNRNRKHQSLKPSDAVDISTHLCSICDSRNTNNCSYNKCMFKGVSF